MLGGWDQSIRYALSASIRTIPATTKRRFVRSKERREDMCTWVREDRLPARQTPAHAGTAGIINSSPSRMKRNSRRPAGHGDARCSASRQRESCVSFVNEAMIYKVLRMGLNDTSGCLQ